MSKRENKVDLRVGRAFSDAELVLQKYRSLSFWANILTLVLIGLFFVSLASPVFGHGEVWVLFVVGLLARFLLAVAKLYYEEVYEIRRAE